MAGSGRAVEPVDRSLDRLGLQAEVLGGEQDFGLAEGVAGCLELMRELVGVGGDLVEAREHDQAGEAGVQHCTGWGGNARGFLF